MRRGECATRIYMRTIMIMAGGTGGHVFPALAVAGALRERGWKVVWLGTRQGLEARLVPERGYDMEWLRFSGVRGKGLLRLLVLPYALLAALVQSLSILRRRRPDVVLGMGGYVTFPGGMMAALIGTPLAIHEQNSIAGLANKVLAKLADRVLVAFPDTLPKATWTGNPVRADIAALPAPAARYASRSGPLRVLVVGGSLGAQVLNDVVPKALALLPEDARPRVMHQAGAKHIDALRANYTAAGVNAEITAFIDDMRAQYAAADLLICRAGAMTVAELAAAGVASVLVPFPHAVDDHQTTNAHFLSSAGAAMLIPQPEFTAERIAQVLRETTRAACLEMAEKARTLAKLEATATVANVCVELAGMRAAS
jgi:UDP-N-acetylglucosamine--N-acetylmuramyl-(pentapeptide) pyrophosphoryl-undecaprenol N-acetylglucosamine transferase